MAAGNPWGLEFWSLPIYPPEMSPNSRIHWYEGMAGPRPHGPLIPSSHKVPIQHNVHFYAFWRLDSVHNLQLDFRMWPQEINFGSHIVTNPPTVVQIPDGSVANNYDNKSYKKAMGTIFFTGMKLLVLDVPRIIRLILTMNPITHRMTLQERKMMLTPRYSCYWKHKCMFARPSRHHLSFLNTKLILHWFRDHYSPSNNSTT
jgi:hypothetical protein